MKKIIILAGATGGLGREFLNQIMNGNMDDRNQ